LNIGPSRSPGRRQDSRAGAPSGWKVPTHGRLEETKDSDIVIFGSGIGVGVEDVLKDRAFLDALHLDEKRQLIGSMCGGAIRWPRTVC
jgi:hypothetical protein